MVVFIVLIFLSLFIVMVYFGASIVAMEMRRFGCPTEMRKNKFLFHRRKPFNTIYWRRIYGNAKRTRILLLSKLTTKNNILINHLSYF